MKKCIDKNIYMDRYKKKLETMTNSRIWLEWDYVRTTLREKCGGDKYGQSTEGIE